MSFVEFGKDFCDLPVSNSRSRVSDWLAGFHLALQEPEKEPSATLVRTYHSEAAMLGGSSGHLKRGILAYGPRLQPSETGGNQLPMIQFSLMTQK